MNYTLEFMLTDQMEKYIQVIEFWDQIEKARKNSINNYMINLKV